MNRSFLWPLAAVGALGGLCGVALVSSRPAGAQLQSAPSRQGGTRPVPQVPVNVISQPSDAAEGFEAPPESRGRSIRRPMPPLPPVLASRDLQLQNVRARVEAQGNIARTVVTQTFRNQSQRTIEGTYLFPLPNEAALSGFSLTQNGKTLRAETLDRDRARQIYEGIVAKLRDPGLLEWADQAVLKAQIFPVPPRGTVEVELSYSQALKAQNGALTYSLPTKLPLAGAAESASIDFRLRDADARNLYSPTQKLAITRDGQGWRATGEWRDDERPVSLLWSRGAERVATSLVTWKPEGEDGYFLLLAAPDARAQSEVAAKDVVFVVDTSGSMAGEKIEQARNAMKTLLGNLRAGDRFNVIAFASDVDPWKPAMVEATPANLKSAQAFAANLRAIGSTNIGEALQEARKNVNARADGDRPTQIVFMTDGQPTVGETDPEAIRKSARLNNGVRLFSFGVGYDVNTRLLDGLAEDNDGASDYVLPNEDIEAKVGALYSKIAFPVLTNPRLEWSGGTVYDQFPRKLPDVFRGSQVAAFGRFKGATPTVRLSGELAGQGNVQFASVGSANAGTSTGEAVARLWATRKIGTMLDEARREGTPLPDEVRAELIRLAKKWEVVTPLTSSLATEDEAMPPTLGNAPLNGARMRITRRSSRVDGNFKAQAGSSMDALANRALSAPVAGQSAVEAAQQTQALRRAEAAPAQRRLGATQQTVAGRIFELRSNVWTDTTYNAKTQGAARIVKFGSTEYFALSRTPQIAKFLALGERVLFVQNGRGVQIEP